MGLLRLKGLLLGVLLVLALAPSVDAKTFCVNASTGSDATAYAALNESTCTASIRRAADVALAGDVVLIAAGTYNAAGTNNRHVSSLNPANSGTSGNPITFEGVGTVSVGLSSGTGVILGCSVRDFITWRNITVDEANGTSEPDTGPVVGHDSERCVFEDLVIDGNGVGHAEVDNHNGIRFEYCDGCVARNNEIRNVYSNSGNGNNGAGIMAYASRNLLIENNWIHDTGSGIFLKGGPWTGTAPGNTIRYNLLEDITDGGLITYAGAPSTDANPTLFYSNIVRRAGDGARYWHFNSGFDDPYYNEFLNNAFYDVDHCLQVLGTATPELHNVFWNNICHVATNAISAVAPGGYFQNPARLTFEHNVYSSIASTWGVLNDGSTLISFENWLASPYSQDSATPAGIADNPLFVDAVGGDFHLQAGSPARELGRARRGVGGADGTTIPAGAYPVGNEVIGLTDGAPVVIVPDAPTIGTATAGNAQATVTFSPPVDNGGAAITSYTATSTPGSLTATGASSPLTVTGLTNGVSYTFTVIATNSEGDSAASAPSNSVTPEAPVGPVIGGGRGTKKLFKRRN